MTSASDRPFATLSAAQLELRIAANAAQQKVLAELRTRAARHQLAQLKRTCADLINERNARADMRELPF